MWYQIDQVLRFLQSAENELYRNLSRDPGVPLFPSGWKNTPWGRRYETPPPVPAELEPVATRIRAMFTEIRDVLAPMAEQAEAARYKNECERLATALCDDPVAMQMWLEKCGFDVDEDGNLWDADGHLVTGADR